MEMFWLRRWHRSRRTFFPCDSKEVSLGKALKGIVQHSTHCLSPYSHISRCITFYRQCLLFWDLWSLWPAPSPQYETITKWGNWVLFGFPTWPHNRKDSSTGSELRQPKANPHSGLINTWLPPYQLTCSLRKYKCLQLWWNGYLF